MSDLDQSLLLLRKLLHRLGLPTFCPLRPLLPHLAVLQKMLSFPLCLISLNSLLILISHAWACGCSGLWKTFEAYWLFLFFVWSLSFAVEVEWRSVQAVNVSLLKEATLWVLANGREVSIAG